MGLRNWRLIYEYPLAFAGAAIIIYGACTGQLAVPFCGGIVWKGRTK